MNDDRKTLGPHKVPCEWYGKPLGVHDCITIENGAFLRCIKCKNEFPITACVAALALPAVLTPPEAIVGPGSGDNAEYPVRPESAPVLPDVGEEEFCGFSDCPKCQPNKEQGLDVKPECQHRSIQLCKVQNDTYTAYVCGRCAAKFQVEPAPKAPEPSNEPMFPKHRIPWGFRPRQA